MKPIFEKIPKRHDQAFFVKHFRQPALDMPYHYHPEFELTLTLDREGKRFVGNSVTEIAASDLVFLGKNLPHCFIGNSEIASASRLVVVQFHFELFGPDFLTLPEALPLRRLIQHAQRGISIPARSQGPIKEKMLAMEEADALYRIVLLLEILYLLSRMEDYQLLSSQEFNRQYHSDDYDRLNEVYNYIIQNFKNEITLKEVSQVANLTETAFCRFFKARTTKTLKAVVNEMRISYACDLILKGRLGQMSVVQIAEEAGFRNLSNFNRQFKRITGTSPKRYAKEFNTHALQAKVKK
ncbi:MAG: AraC family transcriptional regulator [Bacteroidota bacterium]